MKFAVDYIDKLRKTLAGLDAAAIGGSVGRLTEARSGNSSGSAWASRANTWVGSKTRTKNPMPLYPSQNGPGTDGRKN